jgi:hypothetical protein
MLRSHCQKAGERHSIKIANRSFEDVTEVKYLGTTLTDQNCTYEEIKSTLNLGNALIFTSDSLVIPLLSGNVKVKNIQNHNSASCFVWV